MSARCSFCVSCKCVGQLAVESEIGELPRQSEKTAFSPNIVFLLANYSIPAFSFWMIWQRQKMLYYTQVFVVVIHLLTTFYNARKNFIRILNVQRSNAVYILTSLNKFIWKFMKKELRIGWIRQDKRKRSMSVWKVFSTKQRPEINVENVITKRSQGP